jgi:hypothetical protein
MSGLVELAEGVLFDTWDQVDAAIDAIVCAQPAQMTKAGAELEIARRLMRCRISEFSRARARAAQEALS